MLVLTNRGAIAIAEHKAMFDAAIARDVARPKAEPEQHIRNGLVHTLEAMQTQG